MNDLGSEQFSRLVSFKPRNGCINEQSNEQMTRKIPIEELRRTEAACNALANLQQDHRPLIRTLEGQYGVSIQERRIRHIVGGGAGSEQIKLVEGNQQ